MFPVSRDWVWSSDKNTICRKLGLLRPWHLKPARKALIFRSKMIFHFFANLSRKISNLSRKIGNLSRKIGWYLTFTENALPIYTDWLCIPDNHTPSRKSGLLRPWDLKSHRKAFILPTKMTFHFFANLSRKITIFPERLVIFPERLVIFPERLVIFPERLVIFPERLVIFPERLVIFLRTLFHFSSTNFVLPLNKAYTMIRIYIADISMVSRSLGDVWKYANVPTPPLSRL